MSHHRFALFRCPVCRGDLALVERRLACTKAHSFDLAKSGYVNLTRGRKHAPAAGGDTRAQLEHRARFLARGYFDAIADAIADHAPGRGAILEAGCGTGFHLARIAQRLAPHLRELRGWGLLGAAADKDDQYRARLTRDFGAPMHRRILQHVALERDAVMDAILMGPSARHLSDFEPERIPEQMAVTIDVVLLLARRR